MSDRSRWGQISEIAADAMELSGKPREAFLERACGDDVALREAVDRLVASDERAGSFMERSPARLWKRMTPAGAPAERPSRAPSSALENVPGRMRLLAVLFPLTFGTSYIFGYVNAHVLQLIPLEYHSRAADVMAVLIVIFAAGLYVAARPGKLSPARLLQIGLVFEVLAAFVIAFSEFADHTSFEELLIWGISWNCVWIVAYTLALGVPTRPRDAALGAFASAATVPLALLIAPLSKGLTPPEPGMFVVVSIPTFLTAALAVLLNRTLFRLASDLDRARRMGSYTLERRLGAGGMGEVWLAKHHMLARPAAIKLVRTDLDADDSQRLDTMRRFEREAHATAALSSPHTVRLYDFGTTDAGVFYYVMELLDGLDLDTMIERHGPVPTERAVHLLVQACHSLEEAHQHGLVHRDVKPANIYACRAGTAHDFVKVLDFGLVRPRAADRENGDGPSSPTRLTNANAIIGTPAYMAPEMATDGEVDPRTDLYAMGCVGYWLLTGRAPFEGSPLRVITDHIQTDPEPISRLAGREFPQPVEELLLSCLQKAPSDRPQTAVSLAEQLLAVEVDQPWTPERATSWWRDVPSA